MPEAKILILIRIKGITHVDPTCKKILQLFRLRQLHNAVIIRNNKATWNMLRKIEPHVAYGIPSRKLISDLIYKRGFGKINKQRIPLTNNEIIEENLGEFNIICMEDLIHEIVTCGPHFKQASNFLWPFKLRCPRHGFLNKKYPYQMKGDWGNREEEINELVKRML